MRCCRCREVRFETGAVGSESGEGLIQDAVWFGGELADESLQCVVCGVAGRETRG